MFWDSKDIESIFRAPKLDANKAADACGQIFRQQKLLTFEELAKCGHTFGDLVKGLPEERRHQVLKIAMNKKRAERGL